MRGFRGAGFLDLLAALAEGVVAVFRGFVTASSPGDFYEMGLTVPVIPSDTVARHAAVRTVAGNRSGGNGEIERVGIVGNVVGAVLGLDVECIRTGGEILIRLEAVSLAHSRILPHAGDAGFHLHCRRFVGFTADDDLFHPAGTTDAGDRVEGVVAVSGHSRSGPGSLYLRGDVASGIVEKVVAGVGEGGAGQRCIEQRADLVL